MGATRSVRLANLQTQASIVREHIDGMIEDPTTATIEEFQDTLSMLQTLSNEIHKEETEMRR